MAATMLGSLLVSLGLESGQFKSGLSDAEKELRRSTKRIESIGSSMGDLGKKMSLAVTAPLVALGVTSVKAAMESQDAIAQVNAALKSMGEGAGRTSKQLEGLASGLMRQSLYDDDEILRKVTANLLTFGNIAGEQFDRAQAAAVDLAARMGTDLQSATMMLGKALNDPAKGLAALRRVGIQFTEQQQKQIEAMTKAGDAAGAQAIMLKELERQFGGSAKAARDANPLAAAQMSWAEFQETVGEKLLPLLPRLADALTSILDAFGKLTPGMQTALIVFGGLAAAFGPLLVGLGAIVTAMAPFLAALQLAFASGGVLLAAKAAIIGLGAALGPFLVPLAALAAAGALIYANWDNIAPVLTDLWQTIQTTIGPPLQRMIEALSQAFGELWRGPLGSAIKAVAPILADLAMKLAGALGGAQIDLVKRFAAAIGFAFDAIALAVRAVVALFDGSFAATIGNAVRQAYEKVKTWLLDKLGVVWESVKAKIDQVKGWFFGLYDAVVGHSYIPDMVDGIAAHMARLDAVMVEPAKKGAAAATAAFRKMADEVRPILDRLFPEAAALKRFREEMAALDSAEGAKLLSPDQANEARHRLRMEGAPATSIEELLAGSDQALVSMGKVQSQIRKFIGITDEAGEKAKATSVSIAKSFKDMADDTLSAFDRMARAIKGGGFLDILGSVVGLGLQLGSIGLFGKGIQTNINAVPKYAGGTNFHPGGLAVVGERGPELVSMPRGSKVTPNNQMGGLVRVVVDTSELLMARIVQGDQMATVGGASLAQRSAARSGKWSLNR